MRKGLKMFEETFCMKQNQAKWNMGWLKKQRHAMSLCAGGPVIWRTHRYFKHNCEDNIQHRWSHVLNLSKQVRSFAQIKNNTCFVKAQVFRNNPTHFLDRRDWGVCWTQVRWAILHLQQRFSYARNWTTFCINFQWMNWNCIAVFKMNFCFKMQRF